MLTGPLPPHATCHRGKYLAGYIEDRWIKKEGPRHRQAGTHRPLRQGLPVSSRRHPRCPGQVVRRAARRQGGPRRAGTDSERGEFVDPRDGSITLDHYVTRFWQTGVRGAPGTINASTNAFASTFSLNWAPSPCGTSARRYCAWLHRHAGVNCHRDTPGRSSAGSRTSSRPPSTTSAWCAIRCGLSPCGGPRRPRIRGKPGPGIRRARREALNARYRIAVVLGLGCGLRQAKSSGCRRRTSTSAVESAYSSTGPTPRRAAVLHPCRRAEDPRRRHAFAGRRGPGPVLHGVSRGRGRAAMGRPGARTGDEEVPARHHHDVR